MKPSARLLAAAALSLFATTQARAQAAGERVRGRVLTDSGVPIANADVMVTKTADRLFKVVRSGADGAFSINFDDRTGDYAVRASAAGFRPVTKHAVVPPGSAEVVVVIALPRGTAQQLNAVVTQAARMAPRPDRPALNATGVGASESVTVPQGAAQRIGPDVAGDLAALASMSSNVAPVSGGISVFGLGASQNAVTLNGLAFGGAEIPRDVRASVRVSASSYDPAVGWFSGARTNVQLATGGLFSSRTGHVSGDAPLLQASDPPVRQLGQRFTNANLSLGGDGQLVQDRYAYNYGIQATRRTTDIASLQGADADVLARIGLSGDSAVRFASLAQGLGVAGGAPRTFTAQNLTFLGRIDHSPYDWSTLTSATTTAGITAYARVGQTDAAGISPLATANHAGTSSQLAGALQGELSHYTADNWLNTVRTGISFSRNGTTPYTELPIGGAVPAPAWTAWAASPLNIPTQCAGGPSALADVAPQVRLVDPQYAPSRSWRGNLGWTSSLKGNVFSIDGAWSTNLSQPGTVDLNFAGVTQLVTADEGRPIFVPSASIVSGSGLVSPVVARRSASFGRVVEGVSDLQSTSRQLTFTLRPKLAPPPAKLGDIAIGYTLASIDATQRGFDATTFADPGRLETARGDLDARHRFTIQGIVRPAPGYYLFLFGRLQSGTPYTPMIASDVNGDGLANDRAFVFSPSQASGAAVAGGMNALLSSPDARARECLSAQLGRAAARNSCEGPWTAALNANLRIDGDRLHIPRASLFIDFQNPLAGIDQLVHGSSGAHGWGSAAAPDPVLYRVRGFDPATSRFAYEVNPRFGQTLPNGVGNVRAPFRLTFDVSIDLGRSLPNQQLDRWLGTGAGPAGGTVDASALARRLSRNVPDPYAQLLVQADSLLLGQAQVVALQDAQVRLRTRTDSAWRALASYLTALPPQYDAGAASERVDKTIGDVWEITRQNVRATLPSVLDAVQLSTLSGWAGQLWRAAGPIRIRIYGG